MLYVLTVTELPVKWVELKVQGCVIPNEDTPYSQKGVPFPYESVLSPRGRNNAPRECLNPSQSCIISPGVCHPRQGHAIPSWECAISPRGHATPHWGCVILPQGCVSPVRMCHFPTWVCHPPWGCALPLQDVCHFHEGVLIILNYKTICFSRK